MPHDLVPMSDRLELPASTRKKIELTLDRLIALLDACDPDPDLEPSLGSNPYGSLDQEDDSCDNEPSLGATTAVNQDKAWKVGGDDREFDGDTCPDADGEPSLGSPEFLGHGPNVDQEDWAYSGRDDREADDDREWDEAERGIGDLDGAVEQYGVNYGAE